jgi:hypothetical protein
MLVALGRCSGLFSKGVTSWEEPGQCFYRPLFLTGHEPRKACPANPVSLRHRTVSFPHADVPGQRTVHVLWNSKILWFAKQPNQSRAVTTPVKCSLMEIVSREATARLSKWMSACHTCECVILVITTCSKPGVLTVKTLSWWVTWSETGRRSL